MNHYQRLTRLLLGICLLHSGCGPSPSSVGRLKYALSMGDFPAVKKLHEDGLDLTMTFQDEETTLHLLAESYSPGPELARFLIEQGVDVNAKNIRGQTAWDIIWFNNRESISEKKGLFLAALLEAGCIPTRAPGENGEPFLHLVAVNCLSRPLVKLLAEGQDTEIQDSNGWTPLHHAAFTANYEAAAGLLEAGANPNAETTKTITEYTMRGLDKVVLHEFQAGSRPLDLYHIPPSNNLPSFKALMDKYGGERNPDVNNQF